MRDEAEVQSRRSPAWRSGAALPLGHSLSAQAQAERQLDQVEAIAHVGHWHWDGETRAVRLSPEVCRIFGKSEDWRPGVQEIMAAVAEDDRDWLAIAAKVLIADGSCEATFDYRIEVEGRQVHLHSSALIAYGTDGSPAHAIGTAQDVTELKGYQERLHSLAFYDVVTELPNRALFTERLQRAIDRAEERGAQVGVLIMDIDNFKEVNETLGHRVGDDVLRQTAQRLRECLREYDTVARLGGDEFGFVLPEMKPDADIGKICRKILDTMAEAFDLDGREVFLTGSIGVARYPCDGSDISRLLQFADASMYQAKGAGRNNYQFYAATLTEHAGKRLSLAAGLHRAEAHGELELFYQPQIDLETGALLGAEALLRWNHPEEGFLTPDKFIGIAEETGLIVGIGQWVLCDACLTARRWNRGRAVPLRIAVNVSTRQFRTRNLVDSFREVLRETGCSPDWIEIEITESLLVEDGGEIVSMLKELHALGFSLAIDDFGTGYSALSYLTRFPAKSLKIDRAFVSAIADSRETAELVKAIIAMGRSLHLNLVAEGIEDRNQELFLRLHGCQCGQGYLYGKPMPRERFEQLITVEECRSSRQRVCIAG